ncbi:Transposase IS200 like protein [Planctomycetes bacterium Pla163]|uniref:Transposase IS200 like protein n=1 Tax=Rohdeia mirabilis TaxID=2528008 RepID=A0A518D1S9_9BACT|nr:Transposase IS200 like protein [Planctomycetes bacterium Pla163]
MARRPRQDAPGSWHHVVNRAIAKRPYFETRSDQRYFLARLAAEVRKGRLEVHAYCLMTTHFHLLVRSRVGEMSEAMRLVQNAYSRHFNRRRRRDGPLIRGRYYSKRVDTDRYRRAVVRYIDVNAVLARLVKTPADHEFGSARAFISGSTPPWLSRDWIVPRALELTESSRFDGAAYLHAFHPSAHENVEALVELVEARLQCACEADPIDDLIGRTPVQVREWMIRKAELADGHPLGLPVCGPTIVSRSLERHLAAEGSWVVVRNGRAWDGSEIARVGLLRNLVSMTHLRIGQLLGLGHWATAHRAELHQVLVRSDDEYGRRVASVARFAIDQSA